MRFFTIIVPVLLLLVSVMSILFLLVPSFQELAELRGQVKERQGRVVEGEKFLTQVQELKKQIEEREDEFQKIAVGIPLEEELPALYDLVGDLGATSGLVVESIGASERDEGEGKEQGVRTTDIRLELLGSYEGLKNFLTASRRSARILNVQSVNIKGVGGSEAGVRTVLDIQIDLEAYSGQES